MKTVAMSPNEFKGRHFPAEIILLCVQWSVTYTLSDRDLVEMMEERGISVAHTAILRRAQRDIPMFETTWRPLLTTEVMVTWN